MTLVNLLELTRLRYGLTHENVTDALRGLDYNTVVKDVLNRRTSFQQEYQKAVRILSERGREPLIRDEQTHIKHLEDCIGDFPAYYGNGAVDLTCDYRVTAVGGGAAGVGISALNQSWEGRGRRTILKGAIGAVVGGILGNSLDSARGGNDSETLQLNAKILDYDINHYVFFNPSSNRRNRRELLTAFIPR